MKTISATEVQTNLEDCLTAVAGGPLAVGDQDHPRAVLMSWDDYQQLAALQEDAWWGMAAAEAEAEGPRLGHDASVAFLKSRNQ